MQASMDCCGDGPAEKRTRRNVLAAAIPAMWAMITAALGLPASVYMLRGRAAARNSEWIDLGDISALPVGEPLAMTFHRDHVDGWKIASKSLTTWLVRTTNSDVIALGPRCTHLGCAHHWDGERRQFVCPCHNSLFSIEGRVLGGPAPRPLDRYEVKIQGKKLLLGDLRQFPEGLA